MRRFLLLALCGALLSGCSAQTAQPTQTTQTVQPVTEATLPVTTERVPSTAPSLEEPIHWGLREDGAFTEGTLFIGDSQTYRFIVSYLKPNAYLGDARYMAVVGAPLDRFFWEQTFGGNESAIYSPEFLGLTYSQAAAQMGETATAIYLMLGTNYTGDTDTAHYLEVVDYLLEVCPNATVHLQKIPICANGAVDVTGVNASLEEVEEYYRCLGIRRVTVIDTFTAIGQNLDYDGIHLNAEGLAAWYDVIVRQANGNSPRE